jgi:hypothetical protein
VLNGEDFMAKKKSAVPVVQAGHRPEEFARACGFSRATLYRLPAELRPKSVKLAQARIIIEDPAAFLARLGSIQQAQAA